LSLDKWLKSEKEGKEKSAIKKEEDKSSKVDEQKQKEKTGSKLQKFMLKCSNSKCNYQKTLMKRELNERDKVCPRCNSKMKILKSS
jgi:acetyl-CoA carboxylase beta subunit